MLLYYMQRGVREVRRRGEGVKGKEQDGDVEGD